MEILDDMSQNNRSEKDVSGILTLESGSRMSSRLSTSSSVLSDLSSVFDRATSNTSTDDTTLSSCSPYTDPVPVPQPKENNVNPSQSLDHHGVYENLECPIEGRPKSRLSTIVPNVAPSLSSFKGLRSERPSKDEQKAAKSAPPPTTSKKRRKLPTFCRGLKPRVCIPQNLSWEEYGRQCILAAQMSRLNPYALHPDEHRYLSQAINSENVNAYLNIRNGILRIWTRNPLVNVTFAEAFGCAKFNDHSRLAQFAFIWLLRNGYINFGCLDLPSPERTYSRRQLRQETICIVGAGMAGIGCARQIEGLALQLHKEWIDRGEFPPNVLILEGRNRIGGRIYSHALENQVEGSLPGNLRNTAEMGAQIITGFDNGNPLDTIIRGQLALRHHLLWDEIVLHDHDGETVDRDRDVRVNKIHNDILERTSQFVIKPSTSDFLQSIPELISVCQEPTQSEYIALQRIQTQDQNQDQTTFHGLAKLQGRTQVGTESASMHSAAEVAQAAGWDLKSGVDIDHSIHPGIQHPSLGSAIDEAVKQYKEMITLTPQDIRLMNWHHADLEYANAAGTHQLSLSGHDQDAGNEFSGRHAGVIGGYSQVPRSLMMLPTPLDVRLNTVVRKIKYSSTSEGAASVECEDGRIIEADHIVLTAPLGVLKAGTIEFEPKLPSWKQGAIDRLGFGLLNKLVLVFEESFWDEKYDMFGLLNRALNAESTESADYEQVRGKFYLVWNCISTSGRPMLIALMSGSSAYMAEVTPVETLLEDLLDRLAKTFAPKEIPTPTEVILTRWKRDPFSFGTYSFVAPDTQPDDYDIMAKPVGNLHFAGEATCGTHPATVHGAYLAGLRAAAEVVEAMIGPIVMPKVLIPDADTPLARDISMNAAVRRKLESIIPRSHKKKSKQTTQPDLDAKPLHIKSEFPSHDQSSSKTSDNSRAAKAEQEQNLLDSQVHARLGPRPLQPMRPDVNPFVLYTKENWDRIKMECIKGKQEFGGHDIKVTSTDVRLAVGKAWRMLDQDRKEPFLRRCEIAQSLADQARDNYEQAVKNWDREADKIKQEWTGVMTMPSLAISRGVNGRQ